MCEWTRPWITSATSASVRTHPLSECRCVRHAPEHPGTRFGLETLNLPRFSGCSGVTLTGLATQSDISSSGPRRQRTVRLPFWRLYEFLWLDFAARSATAGARTSAATGSETLSKARFVCVDTNIYELFIIIITFVLPSTKVCVNTNPYTWYFVHQGRSLRIRVYELNN